MQLVDVYLRSHTNHIYLNDLYKKSGKTEYRRVLLEPSKFKGNTYLVNLLCVAYWILAPFILFRDAIKSACIKRRSPGIDNKYERYFLFSMNPILPKIVDKASISTSNSAWIVKDEEIYKKCETKNYVSYFRYINIIDIWYLYFVSVIAYYKSIFRFGIKVSILAKESFEFLVKFVACSRIPIEAECYFCNHMDRYAILIDNLPHSNKHLLQHGTEIIRKLDTGLTDTEMTYNEEYKFWSYNLPYKYQSVKKVYAFSEKEYIALCCSILNNKPFYEIVGYSLKTSPLNDSKRSVMIIGYYSNYADKEELLLNKLQNHNLRLFLKNHPCQSVKWYDEMVKRYDFELIDKPYFPAVDYVISYDSTLALEYEAVGCKVLYYDEYDVDQIVERILMGK